MKKKKFPNIYWAPEFHKYSSKARFIIAASRCSVKPLPKVVISVLKLMYNQISSKMHYFSANNSSWPVQNNKPVKNLTMEIKHSQ